MNETTLIKVRKQNQIDIKLLAEKEGLKMIELVDEMIKLYSIFINKRDQI